MGRDSHGRERRNSRLGGQFPNEFGELSGLLDPSSIEGREGSTGELWTRRECETRSRRGDGNGDEIWQQKKIIISLIYPNISNFNTTFYHIPKHPRSVIKCEIS